MDFPDQFRVQGGGRLVKEHHFGLHGQRACDGNALFLPSGKFRRIFGHVVFQPDPLQLGRGPLPGFAAGQFAHLDQSDHHIVQGVEGVEKVEVLEDHPDFLAIRIQFPFAALVDPDAVEIDVSRIHFDQEIDAVQQRALAAPGRSDHHFDIAAEQIQRGPLQHGGVAEMLVDVLNA